VTTFVDIGYLGQGLLALTQRICGFSNLTRLFLVSGILHLISPITNLLVNIPHMVVSIAAFLITISKGKSSADGTLARV
jgi:hypothetical protein